MSIQFRIIQGEDMETLVTRGRRSSEISTNLCGQQKASQALTISFQVLLELPENLLPFDSFPRSVQMILLDLVDGCVEQLRLRVVASTVRVVTE